MIEFVILLFLTAAISFWGSLQLGPVNLTVLHTAVVHGKKEARLVALGGIVPEMIYATLAIVAQNLLTQFDNALFYLEVAVGPIFIIVGLAYIFQKNKPNADLKNVELKVQSPIGFFTKGFAMGALNPQLLPFWLIILSFYSKNNLYHSEYGEMIGFIFGSAIGAFAILWLFIFIGNKFKDFINGKIGHRIKIIIGVLFLIIGIIQTIMFLKKNY